MSLMQDIELWGGNIPWLQGLREKGKRSFLQQGLPTVKTEAWKYTAGSLNVLDKEYKISTEPAECDGHCHQNNPLPFEVLQIHYCDGKLHHIATDTISGIQIKPLIEAIDNNDVKAYLNKSFDMDHFPFAALNTFYLEQGLFIVIEKGVVIDKPIYIRYFNHDENNTKIQSHIRNVIVLESGARASIIEHFVADNNAWYLHNIVNEVYVGAQASLTHITLQKEAAFAHHIALNSVQIRQNGSYNAFCLQKRCLLSRHETNVNLLQQGASAEVNGIYRLQQQSILDLNGQGICDITTNIRHLAPHTFSNQLVKGVAESCGKGVFQGQIHIAQDAQQCEGFQLHRALLLDDKAEIDCKPDLEIFADDVKCSHGSSCGDLDKEQLYYMQLRGIPFAEAQQILVKAYLEESLNKIADENIKCWIKQNF